VAGYVMPRRLTECGGMCARCEVLSQCGGTACSYVRVFGSGG